MKSTSLLVVSLSVCASLAQAQSGPRSGDVFRLSLPTMDGKRALAVIQVDDLFEPGMTDTATQVFGYPGKRMGLATVAEPRRLPIDGIERDRSNNRAWGISVGAQGGPFTFRIAHQNKNVAKVAPSMPLGLRTDAKNSIIAANIDVGPVKAYTAYSANRGWGSSPLWNPDNPYGAAMVSTPSTNSRDILVGMAMPMGATTLLASFVRKNDRDAADLNAQQLAVGATYAMSRKLDFYAALSHTQLRPGALNGIAVGGSSAVNIGMRHSF